MVWVCEYDIFALIQFTNHEKSYLILSLYRKVKKDNSVFIYFWSQNKIMSQKKMLKRWTSFWYTFVSHFVCKLDFFEIVCKMDWENIGKYGIKQGSQTHILFLSTFWVAFDHFWNEHHFFEASGIVVKNWLEPKKNHYYQV